MGISMICLFVEFCISICRIYVFCNELRGHNFMRTYDCIIISINSNSDFILKRLHTFFL